LFNIQSSTGYQAKTLLARLTLGYALAEQPGWHWALTNFALDVFRSSSREDLPEIAPVAADEEAES
jgi:hypothetical protein